MNELIERMRMAMLAQIFGRGIEMIMHREEVPPDEVGLRGFAQTQGDIGFSHPKIKLLIGKNHFDLDVGIEFKERAKARRQPAHADPETGRDPQLTMRLFAAFVERHLGGIQLGHDLAHRAQEKLALLGQDEAARDDGETRGLSARVQGRSPGG